MVRAWWWVTPEFIFFINCFSVSGHYLARSPPTFFVLFSLPVSPFEQRKGAASLVINDSRGQSTQDLVVMT